MKERHVVNDQPLPLIAELTRNRLPRRFTGAICAVICLGYLIVGLYPYNFFQQNEVKRDPGGGGISLGRYAIVYSEKSIFLGRSGGGITIEMMLRPDWQLPWRKASILSLYSMGLECLVVGQQGSDLLLSIPVGDAGSRTQHREIRLKDGLPPHSRRILVVTSGGTGTNIYIDGTCIGRFAALIPRVIDLQGQLVIGDSPEGRHGWRGEMSGCALFARVVDAAEVVHHRNLVAAGGFRALSPESGFAALYFFDEKAGHTVEDQSPSHIPLLIPGFYHVLHRTYLLPIWRDSPQPLDVGINILGFVPFGFFYFIYASRHRRVLWRILITVALSASVSALIEILQAFIPRRTSSMADLICNTLGGLIGSLVAFALIKATRRNGPADAARMRQADSHLRG